MDCSFRSGLSLFSLDSGDLFLFCSDLGMLHLDLQCRESALLKE